MPREKDDIRPAAVPFAFFILLLYRVPGQKSRGIREKYGGSPEFVHSSPESRSRARHYLQKNGFQLEKGAFPL